MRPAKLLMLSLLAASAACGLKELRPTPARTLIEFEVSVEGGQTVSFVSLPGEPSRLTLPDGKTLAIDAKLESWEDREVSFRLLEVTASGRGTEDLQPLEEATLRPGAAFKSKWNPRLVLRVERVAPVPEASTSELAVATTGPITDDLVAWEMLVAGRKNIRLTGRGGELARFDTEEATYGIAPRVEGQNLVQFRVFEIHQVEGAGEAMKQIEKFNLAPGDERLVKGDPDFGLRLGSVRASQAPDS